MLKKVQLLQKNSELILVFKKQENFHLQILIIFKIDKNNYADFIELVKIDSNIQKVKLILENHQDVKDPYFGDKNSFKYCYKLL